MKVLVQILFIGFKGYGFGKNDSSGVAENAIAESNRLYGLAFSKNKTSLFVERYSDDTCIMPPNTPSHCGENAALEFYNISYNEMGVRNVVLTTEEIFGVGDKFVTEKGIFELFDANNKLMLKGKYLVLWKKTPKGWKMFRDSFSSDTPQ